MLKEINQDNTFMTLIKGDFRDMDFIYKNNTFPNKTFKQEVYNKEEELTKYTSNNDISIDIDMIECIELYFEKYANCKIKDIANYDDSILYELSFALLPEIIKREPYRYPRYLEEIKIIKNGKVYEFSKTQTESNITKAQEYIIDYIKSF